uniref:Uncharacterized protein n=1 Tax=Anguilla anguilla TaxID=7936 RepID=A0A0E9RJH0_ANGAN
MRACASPSKRKKCIGRLYY